ncbi:hypothetical protein N7499_006772 [Penicillium canescens]|uniref:Enoyl-CoA hydratase/isomerase family protein n=1 Tax=Penicillium canescens TaxID=5083 RepID=A0AAD6IE60_PENCN|nr:uncharacterized protein N7446_002463 [Penicillium canescens]KAJ5996916.1 hypothetical protein N7522_008576 [Penicillium canescens]KAJ6044266.1 hypothetical protein N7460_005621 [Penicillium canescens]KAJ6055736.1 hypothetical protein N7444_004834 [Penicillium canescens]KAJ6074686.1 hypothetical protein N7446_002463 [Penicillium canescens]KAJ6081898.1 hypothetical protein N7499_006772 [Penicillium canescens]
MTTLFSVPIASTGGSIVCANPTANKGQEQYNIYLLTITSPRDNRLTPTFIDALLLSLDIIEHHYPKGVIVTTSGIAKFYSNGLDLELVVSTKGFLEKWMWPLFRRFLTYPMPSVCLLNGHAFAGGFILAMYHDYRIQNPERGFLCVNELEFGVTLQIPVMRMLLAKLNPATFRNMVLGSHRFGGKDSLQAGIVDGVGGLDEVLGLIRDRKLLNKAETGIYGTMKEEMYAGALNSLDDYAGNLAWREKMEGKRDAAQKRSLQAVAGWEKDKAKL